MFFVVYMQKFTAVFFEAPFTFQEAPTCLLLHVFVFTSTSSIASTFLAVFALYSFHEIFSCQMLSPAAIAKSAVSVHVISTFFSCYHFLLFLFSSFCLILFPH